MEWGLEANHDAASHHDIVLVTLAGIYVQRKSTGHEVAGCQTQGNLAERTHVKSKAGL